MNTPLPSNRSEFDGPATYQVRVLGRVPSKWRDRLEGMTITEGPLGTKPFVTTLFGDLSNQAALAGVLTSLYELHLPVLSVERLELSH